MKFKTDKWDMATYLPDSGNERDVAAMNYSREPLPSSYSEASVLPRNVMMYTNYASSPGTYSQQQKTSIGMAPVAVSHSNTYQEFLANLGGSRVGDHDFSACRDGRDEMLLMQQTGGATSILQTGQNLQSQGLSLSLSPQVTSGLQISSLQYRNPDLGFSSILSPHESVSRDDIRRNGCFRDHETSQSTQSRKIEYMQPDDLGRGSNLINRDVSQFGMSSIARNNPNSKYLKAAQQLLDEVVNVPKALKQHDCKKDLMRDPREISGTSKNGTSVSSNAQDSISNTPSELSAAEKQDLQNKMTKLFSMLEEVDKRYKQYFHQMHIVVSSFDAIAGCGASKPYTALALQTISSHFRCLRDAINGQIQVTNRILGEQDGSASSKGVGISRLRYVDQQLRQQRALQQLGVMQQHTWRPQRGLPETSVSILRAWLFEHFLHPYPKDSDKIKLARQTGLTRGQVSNWFINARVRLWKPMVEEMYKEEAGDAEMGSNSSSELTPKAVEGDLKASVGRKEDVQTTATSAATQKLIGRQIFELKPTHVPDVEMGGSGAESNFQDVNPGEIQVQYEVGNSRVNQKSSVNECNIFPDTMVHTSASSDEFVAAYHASELERFGNGSDVSLTLGLQQCENRGMPMSDGAYHNFVITRGQDVYDPAAPSVAAEVADYDCMDSGNREHRFSFSHLLHDFVA